MVAAKFWPGLGLVLLSQDSASSHRERGGSMAGGFFPEGLAPQHRGVGAVHRAHVEHLCTTKGFRAHHQGRSPPSRAR